MNLGSARELRLRRGRRTSAGPPVNPFVAVALAVLAMGSSAVLIKFADAPPIVLSFYRLLFTEVLLAPMALRELRRGSFAFRASDLGLMCISGLFLGLHFTLWIASLRYTSVASSTVLVSMQPLFVVALSHVFLGERLSARALGGAALALAGSVLIGAGDFRLGGEAMLGDAMAFAGAACVAVYVVIGRGLRRRLDLLPYAYVVYGAAALLLGIGSAALGQPLHGYSARTWIVFVAQALFPSIMGHTVLNWALRFIPASVVSVAVLGEPVGATALNFVVFRQAPTPAQALGGSIIIGGLTWFALATMKDSGGGSEQREAGG